ncbi:Lrp/AsnC family transcriptional regulator [Lampropedia aestuarii]|uniref:Lrp/AsnC family transcriptional regulator n=1 Tax=Lampropedia aestuarii TaxID=2562762 RepID=UPI002469A7C0|nr:Lrp/AsnC family transcriptional regulator [Lampropedia aestuarii]MDH5859256.1 Lrp/AsnC family transcriptional regulator [Lampropedia aestuarii]
MAELDNTDRKILKLLQADGRLANAEIASQVALSPQGMLETAQAPGGESHPGLPCLAGASGIRAGTVRVRQHPARRPFREGNESLRERCNGAMLISISI